MNSIYNMLIGGIVIFIVAILNFIFPKFFLKRGIDGWLCYRYFDPSDSTIKATRIVTAIVALGSIAVIVIGAVALAWMQPVESQTGSSAGDLINFDLVLRNPNGIEVARSNSTKNNVELIDYDVTSYGIYTIEIVPVNTYGKTTDLAIAWY